MYLDRLWVHDFRSYAAAELALAPGLTVLIGRNGTGKSNLLEAAAYLAVTSSFRGVPNDGLIRLGTERAVVRGEVRNGERSLLIEAELSNVGRNRVLINKQPMTRSRQLREAFQVSVFSPDDLVLVKGGPAERRAFLDGVLAALHPRNDALLTEVERILRQRNALLKQAAGRLTPEVGLTLDVWDAKLAQSGAMLAKARAELLVALGPTLVRAYADIADRPAPITATYRASWGDDLDALDEALARGRSDDIRRGLSLVGPHRDELVLEIEGRPSRTHASQGEQRSLALALRLAGHRHLTEALGESPLLLLDDVFSELDPVRSAALIQSLPPGQAILATAGVVPPRALVEATFEIRRELGESSVTPRSGLADLSSTPFWRPGESTDRPVDHLGLGDKPGETVDESFGAAHP